MGVRRSSVVWLVASFIIACEAPQPFEPPGGEIAAVGAPLMNQGGNPEEEWQDAEPLMHILLAQTYMFPGPPSVPEFGMLTELSNPLPLVTMPAVRQDWVATYSIDGTGGNQWGPDIQYHLAPGGLRSESYSLSDIQCADVVEEAQWNVIGGHFGQWQHVSVPYLTLYRGPEFDSAEGYCEVEEIVDPPSPPPGGGGNGGENCNAYLVTIYENDGNGWEIVDQFIVWSCP
jgi:hypothetical protein